MGRKLKTRANPSRRINSESAGLQNRSKKGETVSGHDGTDIQSQTQGRGRRDHSTRRPSMGPRSEDTWQSGAKSSAISIMLIETTRSRVRRNR